MQTRKPTRATTHRANATAMLVCLLGFSCQGQSLVAPFTRLTSGPWTESAYSFGVASGDYNNDGWPDLVVGHHGTACSLYRNNNGTNFTKVTTGPISTLVLSYAHAPVWFDYDNDGWQDLVVACVVDAPTPATYLFHGLGNGVFERVLTGPLATDTGRAVAVAPADIDGDGRLDLFVGRGALVRDVADTIYSNHGPAGFLVDTNLTFAPLRTDQGSWADFDGDGDLDLLVVHASQQGNTLYRNNGQWQFEVVQGSGLDQLGNSAGAAWGDFDNDGDLDLIVNNWSTSGGPFANFFYRNNGDSTFTQITNGPIATDTGYSISCAWVDYDNDGWLDMFISSDVRSRLYHNQGDGTFAKVTVGALVTDSARFAGMSWLDYDGDGFLDVYVACGSLYTAQPDAFYRNNGNTNAWIKVRCVGTDSNRSAIGTTVCVKANIAGTNRWQMRQIVGNEGWLSFNNLDVVVGLGDATVVDTLRIEWPSGIVQELHNVPVKQTLVMVEKTTSDIAKRGDTDFELKLTGPRQQRYSLETSTDLLGWSPIASVTITNADGTAICQGILGSEPARYFRAIAR
jgi:hypothetical protein